MKKSIRTITSMLLMSAVLTGVASSSWPTTYYCYIKNHTDHTIKYDSVEVSGHVDAGETKRRWWASTNPSYGMDMTVAGCHVKYDEDGTASGPGVMCKVDGDEIIVTSTQ